MNNYSNIIISNGVQLECKQRNGDFFKLPQSRQEKMTFKNSLRKDKKNRRIKVEIAVSMKYILPTKLQNWPKNH